DRCLELAPVDAAVAFDERHERRQSSAAAHHVAEETVDFIGVADELRSSADVATPQPQRDRFALTEVQLPLPASRGEQGVAVCHVAHGLPVGPAALTTGVGEQHQAAAERRLEREPEEDAHRHVDPLHTTRAPLESGWGYAAMLSHDVLLASKAVIRRTALPWRVLRPPAPPLSRL